MYSKLRIKGVHAHDCIIELNGVEIRNIISLTLNMHAGSADTLLYLGIRVSPDVELDEVVVKTKTEE